MPRHGVYPHDIVPPRSSYFDAGRFGRMFGKLPPFAADTPDLRAGLIDIGRVGGTPRPTCRRIRNGGRPCRRST